MATGQQLANAATVAPAPGGGNCHEAVFAWLVTAESVRQNQIDRLILWRGGYTDLAERVLALQSDPRIRNQMDTLRLNAPGFIVGFHYPHQGFGIAHSMVTLGGARLAGRNNLNVRPPEGGGGVGYQVIRIQDLSWLLHGNAQVVGRQHYHVHITTVDEFERRFAQQMADWQRAHPLFTPPL